MTAKDKALVDNWLSKFKTQSVADYAKYISNVIPKASDIPHEMSELMEAVERHHRREYGLHQVAHGEGHTVFNMMAFLRLVKADIKAYEEAAIMSLLAAQEPTTIHTTLGLLAKDSDGKVTLDIESFDPVERYTGKRASMILIDEAHLVIPLVPKEFTPKDKFNKGNRATRRRKAKEKRRA